MLEAPVDLGFWNHMLDSHQLFLNFRQREKLSCRCITKQQRKLTLGGRGNARRRKKRKRKRKKRNRKEKMKRKKRKRRKKRKKRREKRRERRRRESGRRRGGRGRRR
jgi:hypothetical protein